MDAAHKKRWVSIARMNLALMRLSHCSYFPRTMTIADSLLLRVMLQYVIVWETEGKPATVSKLARALGLSRATTRRKISQLMIYGYLRQEGRHYYSADQMQRLQQGEQLFTRYSAIIAQTCKELDNSGH